MINLENESLLLNYIFIEPKDILDIGGRPLAESRASSFVKQDVNFEILECPYKDSRYKNKNHMNVSPFKLMGRYWKEIMNEISIVQRYYMERLNIESIQLNDLWIESVIGISYPYFLMLKKNNPIIDGEIPLIVGALYKASFGISNVCLDILLNNHRDGISMSNYKISGDVIYDYADKNGYLIGPKEVCAGSANCIKQTIQQMITTTDQDYLSPRSDRFLSEEEYNSLISFSNHIGITFLIRIIYEEIESKHYATLLNVLNQILQSDPDLILLETLHNKLLLNRNLNDFQPLNIPKNHNFYLEIEDEIKKMSDNNRAILDCFRDITNGPGNKNLENTLLKKLEGKLDNIPSKSNSTIIMIQHFIKLSTQYIEREKLYISALILCEKELYGHLAYIHSSQTFDRNNFLKSNNYNFTDALLDLLE